MLSVTKFDAVPQYEDLCSSYSEVSDDNAILSSTNTNLRMRLVDIMLISPVVLLIRNRLVGAGTCGDELPDEFSKFCKQRKITRLFERPTTATNTRPINPTRSEEHAWNNAYCESNTQILNQTCISHRPKNMFTKVSFSCLYALLLSQKEEGEFEKNTGNNLALLRTFATTKFYDRVMKDKRGNIRVTSNEIDDTNSKMLHENRGLVEGVYPYILLFSEQEYNYKLSTSEKEGVILLAKLMHQYAEITQKKLHIPNEKMSVIYKLIYLCGNNNKRIESSDGEELNKIDILGNIYISIVKEMTTHSVTNMGIDKVIYSLMEFLQTSYNNGSKVQNDERVTNCLDMISVCFTAMSAFFPSYYEKSQQFINHCKKSINDNAEYVKKFIMEKSFFLEGATEKQLKIAPCPLLGMQCGSSEVLSFNISLPDGQHSNTALNDYICQGYITGTSPKNLFSQYIPMGKVGKKKNPQPEPQIQLRYNLTMNVTQVQPIQELQIQIDNGETSCLKAFTSESGNIQLRSTENIKEVENIVHVHKILTFYLRSNDDFASWTHDVFHDHNENDWIFKKPPNLHKNIIPFTTGINSYQKIKSENLDLTILQNGVHSYRLHKSIQFLFNYLENECNEIEQVKLSNHNETLKVSCSNIVSKV